MAWNKDFHTLHIMAFFNFKNKQTNSNGDNATCFTIILVFDKERERERERKKAQEFVELEAYIHTTWDS